MLCSSHAICHRVPGGIGDGQQVFDGSSFLPRESGPQEVCRRFSQESKIGTIMRIRIEIKSSRADFFSSQLFTLRKFSSSKPPEPATEVVELLQARALPSLASQLSCKLQSLQC